ncbi:MAG TPA: type II toxin-antitoxin system HicB family antitoxin [Thermoanaerobaculia bacterium]|nr:type II toxin-antitoxin system HicB family antitoxin [Thermoanaerobaculia bacterium]
MKMSSPSSMPARIPVSYRALVHPEKEGGYWAEVPDLPGCFTQGVSLDEIYHNLAEAVASHLDLDTHSVQISLLEITTE